MEAIRHDARLLKENVEAVGVQQTKLRGRGDSVATPKRAFAIHSDTSKTAADTTKKGLHDSSVKKRRVLGDISNKHRNRHAPGDDGASDAVAQTKKALKSVHKSSTRVKKALSAKSVTAPQVNSKPVLGAEPAPTQAPQAQPTKHDEVEEVEHAYGGLSSRTPDASYLASLRDEMLNDIVNSKTRSLIDDYDATEAFDAWKDGDEHKLLTSGAAPSAWWSQPTSALTDESAKSDPLWNDDSETSAAPLLDDVPAPDDFADPVYDEHDDVLDELLNVDVDAACA